MTSHCIASHETAKRMKLQGKPAPTPLIENQQSEGLASVSCSWSRSPRASGLTGLPGAAGGATWAAGGPVVAGPAGAFPGRGGCPPLQGSAFSHRSRFLPAPQAGEGRGEGVRAGANRTGRGMGFGGRAK